MSGHVEADDTFTVGKARFMHAQAAKIKGRPGSVKLAR